MKRVELADRMLSSRPRKTLWGSSGSASSWLDLFAILRNRIIRDDFLITIQSFQTIKVIVFVLAEGNLEVSCTLNGKNFNITKNEVDINDAAVAFRFFENGSTAWDTSAQFGNLNPVQLDHTV